MPIFLKLLGFLIISVALVACGGGSSSGGGASGGGTPPPVVTDTLTLSQRAISVSSTQFEALPAPVTVTASITGNNMAGIIFGTLPGVESLPFWLDVELGNLVNNSVNAIFTITTSDLPPGSYSFTVRAVTFNSNEVVLDTADVVVTFDVAEGIPISLAPTSVDVIMHYASEPINQVVAVTAGNYAWNAFSSEANLDIEEGTGSQDITLSILPAMQEQVDEDGAFQGNVEVFQNSSSNSELFFINYTMVPTLENFGNDVFLNAISGESGGQDAGVNLRGERLNWAVSSDVAWLSFSAESGMILTADDIADSPDGDDFNVIVDGSTLDEGRHEAAITVTADADQTLVIPVVIEVAAQKLEPSTRGVALSRTATTSKLQSAVEINTNANRIANWAATSNAAWLSVTASGTTADDLIVTADPALLPDETFSEALVSFTSPDGEISTTETIRVGFWKSAQAPSDSPVTVGGMFPEDLIVSDPIRPLVYVHSGETEINIVHIYSGTVEKTLTPLERVFNFDVSDDGAFLYLLRGGDGQVFIDVVDLETQEISNTWSFSSENTPMPDLAFGRVSNIPYLFLTTGVIINAGTGAVEPLAGGAFPTSSDVKGNVFCNSGINSAGTECFDLVSAGFEGAKLTSAIRSQSDDEVGQLVMAHDGERVFGVADRVVMLLDTADLSVIQTVEKQAADFAEVAFLGSDGNLYVTYRNDGEVPTDPTQELVDPRRFMEVYDSNLVLLRTIDYRSDGAGGILPILSDAKLSGDEQRIVYLTSDEFLEVNFFSLD